MRFNNTKFIYSALFLVSILLAACLGGSGGSSSSATTSSSTTTSTTVATLSGVVAVGTPIASSSISVVCAAGSKLTATSASDGSWSATISGQTLPCAAEATGGTINSAANTTAYHSVATVAGTMNITPLTDLLVASLAGSTPGTWFTGLSKSTTPLTSVTSTTVSSALSTLSTSFSGLTKLGTTNPITTAFNPTSGNPSDDMLTALATATTNAGVTYSTLLSNTASNTAIPSNVNTQLATAYAGTTSGSRMGGSVQGKALSLAGQVSSFTGTANTAMSHGWADGAAASATLYNPNGITTDGTNLYVVDTGNNKIRKIVIATGVVTTLAGADEIFSKVPGVAAPIDSGPSRGAADGIGTAATFDGPTGITTDGTNLYVVDSNNCKIRKIVIATGEVSSLTGPANARCVNAANPWAADGAAASATFDNPSGITTDGTNLYVADSWNNKIRKIVIATGVVSSFTGPANISIGLDLTTRIGGCNTNVDGAAASAIICFPSDITTDGTNLYVTKGNNQIRQIVIATGVVTTLMGHDSIVNPNGSYSAGGSADSIAKAATFNGPTGITTDGTNLYVVDIGNNKIHKIVIATGVASSLTGTASTAMSSGAADGAAISAAFNSPWGITTDGTNLYVVDTGNNKIRVIK